MRTFPPVIEVAPLEGPVQTLIRPPGSKSITNRALVIASLASGGVSRLAGCLDADDTVAMREGLRALGVLIDDVDDPWLVLGTGGQVASGEARIDALASGTTARFLAALAALGPGPTTIVGRGRLPERPMGGLFAALRRLGARVEEGTGPGVLGVIRGGDLEGGTIEVDGSETSQFMSALMMIGPMLRSGLRLVPLGGSIVSLPYVKMTADLMRMFGARVEFDGSAVVVEPTGYRRAHIEVEADASAASYPLAAAAITRGTVGIAGLSPGSSQSDMEIVQVLEQMGCRSWWQESVLVLSGPEDGLSAVDADMSDAPDAALALAVVCAFAEGRSVIRGLGTLRVKESDRLEALHTELQRIGVDARISGNDLWVSPGTLRAATIETYGDHRMAMAFSVAGLRVAGMRIADPAVVTKTWPSFFEMLAGL